MAPTKKNDQDKYIKMSISFEPKQFDQLMHYCEIQERSVMGDPEGSGRMA